MALDESQGIANEAAAVTPDNGVTFRPSTLYVGAAGDIKVSMAEGGSAILYKAINAASFMPILVTKVYATDTTADNIVRMF